MQPGSIARHSREEALVELFRRLEAASARWDVLRHPFYTRWSCGELTRAELAYYAGEYRHLVSALAATAARAADAGHAAEEAAHIRLWDRFASAIGADLTRPPRPETAACVDAWSPATALEGAAVLCAVESAQPAISKSKLEGLIAHYGFDDGAATEYFRIHSTLDVEHAARSRAVLEHTAADRDADRLAAAAEGALRGNWALLDGVERAFAEGD
jgi:pyrroloquinoline-quinone synthase